MPVLMNEPINGPSMTITDQGTYEVTSIPFANFAHNWSMKLRLYIYGLNRNQYLCTTPYWFSTSFYAVLILYFEHVPFIRSLIQATLNVDGLKH